MDEEQGSREPTLNRPGGPGGDTGPGNPYAAGVAGAGPDGTQLANAATRQDEAGPGDAGSAPGDGAPKRKRSFWRELAILVTVALTLAAIIRIFMIQAFYIPSSSMENTLKIGDMVLVNKLVYDLRPIHRGDIVVFNGLDSWSPPATSAPPPAALSRFAHWVGSEFGVTAGETDFVKRVIGVPGDRVGCCDAQGRVTVNGTALSEQAYLYPRDAPSMIRFDVTVPSGELWVMGDHRAVSYDSREHRGDPGGGAVPENKVIGRAFMVVWPLNRIGFLGIPATFQQRALGAAVPLALSAVCTVPFALARRRLRARRVGAAHRSRRPDAARRPRRSRQPGGARPGGAREPHGAHEAGGDRQPDTARSPGRGREPRRVAP